MQKLRLLISDHSSANVTQQWSPCGTTVAMKIQNITAKSAVEITAIEASKKARKQPAIASWLSHRSKIALRMHP